MDDYKGGVTYIIPHVYCFENFSKETYVCSGHGKCISTDQCECNSTWGGMDCSIPKCFGIISTNSTVCSGNGLCTSPNACVCKAWYWIGRGGEENCGVNVVPGLFIASLLVVFYSLFALFPLLYSCIWILDIGVVQQYRKRHLYDNLKYAKSGSGNLVNDTELTTELTRLIN
jgi:hypothetical protein